MTKQLNKKGTSLVELIAVIVIMGIIAGIAIPVTITVINRQKLNAAVKSAEAIMSAVKQYNSEYVGDATTDTITTTLTYDATTAANKPTSVAVVDGASTSTTYLGTPTAADFLVENLKATGSFTVIYHITDAYYTFAASPTLKVNGYTITFTDGTAAKAYVIKAAKTTTQQG